MKQLTILGTLGAMLAASSLFAQQTAKAPDTKTDVATLQKELGDEKARSAYLAARATLDELEAQLAKAQEATQQAAQALVKQLNCPSDHRFNPQTLSCGTTPPEPKK